MSDKFRIYVKAIFILSGGVGLIMGVQYIRYDEVKKLAKKLNNVRLEYDDFDSKNSILNDVYSKLISYIDDAPNIRRKYIENEYNYRVHSYIPTISNDLVSYTFYDDYIEINLLNNDEVYSTCYYNDDGSYSIICNCRNDLGFDNRSYTLTYNFSSDSVLTDSVIYDGFFKTEYKSVDDDMSYTFVKKNK